MPKETTVKVALTPEMQRNIVVRKADEMVGNLNREIVAAENRRNALLAERAKVLAWKKNEMRKIREENA